MSDEHPSWAHEPLSLPIKPSELLKISTLYGLFRELYKFGLPEKNLLHFGLIDEDRDKVHERISLKIDRDADISQIPSIEQFLIFLDNNQPRNQHNLVVFCSGGASRSPQLANFLRENKDRFRNINVVPTIDGLNQTEQFGSSLIHLKYNNLQINEDGQLLIEGTCNNPINKLCVFWDIHDKENTLNKMKLVFLYRLFYTIHLNYNQNPDLSNIELIIIDAEEKSFSRDLERIRRGESNYFKL